MTINWTPDIPNEIKPVYLALAEALSHDVEEGRLKAGDRLPTHRDLADALKIAVGTVTKAYAEAEKRGLIHSNGRSGTFVGPKEEDAAELSDFMSERPRMIDFSMGRPLYAHDPDLGAALKEISGRRDVNTLLRYPDPMGNESHRAAGVLWVKRLGLNTDMESIILTSGCQNGLFILLASLTKPGDVVFVEEYVYPGIKSAAETLSINLYGIKTDEEGVTPDALAAACRQKKARVLFCSPDLQNPTSSVMSRERREAVVEVARKHGIYIIEDSIYRPLLPNPERLLADMAPERTFLLTSVSKAAASGLRVGFIVSPKGFKKVLLKTVGSVQLMSPALTFEVFSFWMNSGIIDHTIKAKRKETYERQAMVKRMFSDYNVITHDYSYFFWLKPPESITGARFAVEAYKQGVSVATADIFAVENTTPYEAVRIYTAAPMGRDSVETGLNILHNLLNADTSIKHTVFI